MRKRTLGVLLLLVLGFASRTFADEVADGRLGPGALYRLVRPTNWNGSLLLYAQLALSTFHTFLRVLVAPG
jgi:hypothetical protein